MSQQKTKDIFTKTAEAPAQVLARTILATQVARDTVVNTGTSSAVIQKTKDYWHMLGPGLTTGASDDDPSGITTYSQAGARFGFQFLWMALWSFPLSAVIQEMCARIGLVTGRGLAHNIRIYFPRRVLYVCTLLLFVANTFNIGADLGAMAKATQLLYPGFNFYFLIVAFTVFSLLLQVFTSYAKYARYLKWLALLLVSYILSAMLAKLDWSTIAPSAFIPGMSFSKDHILLFAAVLGTTISPYLFFWQTSQEVEEKILQGQATVHERQELTDPKAIRDMRIDVWSGIFFSNLVMFFIIAASGGILHMNGITTITTAAEAAEALRPLAGDATYYLFAIGIVGTGLLAIPVLAGSSSYALAESFHWKEGLYRKLQQAYAFYGIIIISMAVGMGINFIGIDPVKALIYAAIGNALVAPVILLLIVLISSNRKIMGHWVNRKPVTVVGWAAFLLMTFSGVAAIWALFVA